MQKCRSPSCPAPPRGDSCFVQKYPSLLFFFLVTIDTIFSLSPFFPPLKKEMFAKLRESLARAKCDESSLEITRIFSVFSRMQDRGAFLEARIAQVDLFVRSDKVSVDLIGQTAEIDGFGYMLGRYSAFELTVGQSSGHKGYSRLEL